MHQPHTPATITLNRPDRVCGAQRGQPSCSIVTTTTVDGVRGPLIEAQRVPLRVRSCRHLERRWRSLLPLRSAPCSALPTVSLRLASQSARPLPRSIPWNIARRACARSHHSRHHGLDRLAAAMRAAAMDGGGDASRLPGAAPPGNGRHILPRLQQLHEARLSRG